MLVSFLPLLAAIRVRGQISAWDLVACVYLIYALRRNLLDFSRAGRYVTVLAILACAGFAFAASINGSNVLPTISLIVISTSFLGTYHYSVTQFRHGLQPGLIAIFSYSLGVLVFYVLFGSALSSSNPWKYGIGFSLTITILATVRIFAKTKALEVVAAIILMAVAMVFGARAIAAMLAICVLIYLPPASFQRMRYLMKMTSLVGATVIIGIATILVSNTVNVSEFTQPAISRFAQQEYINDNPLLAGRVEPPISIAAVSQAPIFGLGADAPATREIVSSALKIAEVLGYKYPLILVPWWTQGGTIYAHSTIMQYWIAGGLLAGALVFSIFFGLLRALTRIVLSSRVARQRVTISVLFLAVAAVWNLPFSPLTYGSFALIGFTLGALTYIRDSGQHVCRPDVTMEQLDR